MKYLKSYTSYKESSLSSIITDIKTMDILESLNMWHDALLSSVNAEEVDIYETLKIPKDSYYAKLNLDYLSNNIEFINSLTSLSLKKSTVQNTDDYQTFLSKPCRWMFIYDTNSNELEDPVYMLFESWNETLSEWGNVKLYKVNSDSKKFYDKLTSRTMEIIDGDKNYIYFTSNGNEWELQNSDNENDTYKSYFRKDELEKILNKSGIKVNFN
jgi:hypothetical protein